MSSPELDALIKSHELSSSRHGRFRIREAMTSSSESSSLGDASSPGAAPNDANPFSLLSDEIESRFDTDATSPHPPANDDDDNIPDFGKLSPAASPHDDDLLDADMMQFNMTSGSLTEDDEFVDVEDAIQDNEEYERRNGTLQNLNSTNAATTPTTQVNKDDTIDATTFTNQQQSADHVHMPAAPLDSNSMDASGTTPPSYSETDTNSQEQQPQKDYHLQAPLEDSVSEDSNSMYLDEDIWGHNMDGSLSHQTTVSSTDREQLYDGSRKKKESSDTVPGEMSSSPNDDSDTSSTMTPKHTSSKQQKSRKKKRKNRSKKSKKNSNSPTNNNSPKAPTTNSNANDSSNTLQSNSSHPSLDAASPKNASNQDNSMPTFAEIAARNSAESESSPSPSPQQDVETSQHDVSNNKDDNNNHNNKESPVNDNGDSGNINPSASTQNISGSSSMGLQHLLDTDQEKKSTSDLNASFQKEHLIETDSETDLHSLEEEELQLLDESAAKKSEDMEDEEKKSSNTAESSGEPEEQSSSSQQQETLDASQELQQSSEHELEAELPRSTSDESNLTKSSHTHADEHSLEQESAESTKNESPTSPTDSKKPELQSSLDTTSSQIDSVSSTNQDDDTAVSDSDVQEIKESSESISEEKSESLSEEKPSTEPSAPEDEHSTDKSPEIDTSSTQEENDEEATKETDEKVSLTSPISDVSELKPIPEQNEKESSPVSNTQMIDLDILNQQEGNTSPTNPEKVPLSENDSASSPSHDMATAVASPVSETTDSQEATNQDNEEHITDTSTSDQPPSMPPPPPSGGTLQLMECVNGQVKLNEETIETLSKNFEKISKPIHIISVAGNARLGKSTFHNLLLIAAARGETKKNSLNSPTSLGTPFKDQLPRNGLFVAGTQVNTLTKGIWVHPHPVPFGTGYALLVDCEGLDLEDDHSTGLTYLFALLFSSLFTIHDTKTIHNKTLSQLALSLQLLKEFQDPKIFMPRVLFILRDTKKLMWNSQSVRDPNVILENIFGGKKQLNGSVHSSSSPVPSSSSQDVSLINRCLPERYLTTLPPPPENIDDTTNWKRFSSSVEQSMLYKTFCDTVLPLMQRISLPKRHAKSSLCMNIHEVIDDLKNIEKLFNTNDIARIPSVLESHVMQKCNQLTATAEHSLQESLQEFVSSSNPTSSQITSFAKERQEEVMHDFITNCHFLEDSDNSKFGRKIRESLDKIVKSFVDEKLKDELRLQAKREREKRIQLEIERERDEEMRREKQRRAKEEKARRLKETQLKEDRLREDEWESNAEMYRRQQEEKERRRAIFGSSSSSLLWSNKGVLTKGNSRKHSIGPLDNEGYYRLSIRNLSSATVLGRSCSIETDVRVGDGGPIGASAYGEESTDQQGSQPTIFELFVHAGESIHLSLSVISNGGKLKRWVSALSGGNSVEYSCELEWLGR